jgi:hypothetical protein
VRAGDLLRQLDQRLLPHLVRALSRLGQRPARPRVLTSAALLSSVAVLLTAVWATSRQPMGDRTVGEVTRVGVAPGDSIPGYLRSAAADLAGLAAASPTPSGDGTYALVSLSDYLPPSRLAAVLGDVDVSAVFGRVPLPDRQTELVRIPAQRVPEDVVAGMTAVAVRKDREAADYRTRAAALTGGGEADRDLRQVYDSGARVAAQEAAGYRSGCACLYAALVRAEPAVLRGVAARAGVRAVDPAPEVRRLDRAVFTPPLPEQDDVARPPADRVLETTPVPSPPGGPGMPAPTPAAGESSEAAPTVTESSPVPTSTESGAPTASTAPTSPDAPETTVVEPTP